MSPRDVAHLVLLEGIELSTSPLPRECSTTELQQRRGRRAGVLYRLAGPRATLFGRRFKPGAGGRVSRYDYGPVWELILWNCILFS